MKTFMLAICIVALASGVYGDEGAVVCTTQWMPECGTDGVTYGNDCPRKAAGVGLAYSGVCINKRDDDEDGDDILVVADTTAAPTSAAPTTAAPTTDAPATDVPTTTAAPEPTTTVDPNQCSYSLSPVCGEDGVTYPTECIMKLSGVKLASKGSCPQRKRRGDEGLCACDRSLKLVCGQDGVTYANECIMKCERHF